MRKFSLIQIIFLFLSVLIAFFFTKYVGPKKVPLIVDRNPKLVIGQIVLVDPGDDNCPAEDREKNVQLLESIGDSKESYVVHLSKNGQDLLSVSCFRGCWPADCRWSTNWTITRLGGKSVFIPVEKPPERYLQAY